MGEQFGDYEIEKRIGAGGMAEVFLAARRGPEGFRKRVALKRVLPAYNDDPEFVRLFQNEARLAAQLNHQHIASLHDFGAIEGTWYMAMEFVEGCDLRTLITGLKKLEQPMPTDLVLLMAADLSSALAYAHELRMDGAAAQLVHRDVSPSNVLLSQDGAVKLADFGIARAATQGHHTRTGVVKGKVPYMPPEQALGQALDHRVDLFALGVVLYECLSGRRPYEGVTELDTLQRVSKGQHPCITEVAPHTPPLLAEVVERLIKPQASERYASAADVLDALATTPPPTNARRMLGHMVRRVLDAYPPAMSQARFGASPMRSQTFAPPATESIASPSDLAPSLLGGSLRAPVSVLAHAAAPAPGAAPEVATRVSKAPESSSSSSIPPGRKGNHVVLNLPTPAGAPDPRHASEPKTVIVPRASDPHMAAAGSSSFPTHAGPGRMRAWPTSLRVLVGVAVVCAMAFSTAVAGRAIFATASPPHAAVATHPQHGAVAGSSIPGSAIPGSAIMGDGADEAAKDDATDSRAWVAASPAPSAATELAAEPITGTIAEPTIEPARDADTQSDPDEPSPTRSTRRRRDERPAPAAAAAPASERAASASSARGTLRVVAYPIGHVVVDGRDQGASPVSVRLPPGEHTVVVDDFQGTSQSRTATIAAGRTAEVVVRFR